MESKLNILFLCQISLNNAQTVVDHIFAFQEFSCHNIFIIPWMGDLPKELGFDRFDVIVIHYTVVPFLTSFISEYDRSRIVEFQGLKVGFRQDEYQKVFNYYEVMRKLGYALFYTCIPEKHIEFVYPPSFLPGVTFKNTLTGFVPDSFMKYPRNAIPERQVNIGYRARSCAYWLGDLSYEKIKIADVFSKVCNEKKINCDITATESTRLYGKDWVCFLANCKCMLGTESGASVLDFTGELEMQWNELTGSPCTSERVEAFSYNQYRNRYLKGRQHTGLMNQISPRLFEAAAMKTVLILHEGEYSGILIPDKHFIPVKKDYTNIDEVLNKVQDDGFLQNMADITYKEIACNPEYSYKTFINRFDNDVLDCFKGMTKSPSPYSTEEFSALLKKYNYLDIHIFIKEERKGKKEFMRPFDISKLPVIYGKKL